MQGDILSYIKWHGPNVTNIFLTLFINLLMENVASLFIVLIDTFMYFRVNEYNYLQKSEK